MPCESFFKSRMPEKIKDILRPYYHMVLLVKAIFEDGVFDPDLTYQSHETTWEKRIVSQQGVEGLMNGSRIEQRDKFIGQFIPEGSRVLDLGCGDGRFLQYLKNHRRCAVAGLDISGTAVMHAKNRGVEVYLSNFEEPDDPRLHEMAQREWDCVVTQHALMAFSDPERIVSAFKNNSKFQLHAVTNSGLWFDRLRVLCGRFMVQPAAKQSWSKEIALQPGLNKRFWTITDFHTWSRCLGFNCEVLGYRVHAPYSLDFTDKVFLGTWRAQAALYRLTPR